MNNTLQAIADAATRVQKVQKFLREQDAEISALESAMLVLAPSADEIDFLVGMRLQKVASRIRLERITTRSLLGERQEELKLAIEAAGQVASVG